MLLLDCELSAGDVVTVSTHDSVMHEHYLTSVGKKVHAMKYPFNGTHVHM